MPGQASLSDSMTRLSDGMVVQARLHLNQGVDANLRSLGINISYLIFFRFHLFFFVYVLIVIVLLIGSHLRQQKGLERQLRKLVGAPLAHPFWVPLGGLGCPPGEITKENH